MENCCQNMIRNLMFVINFLFALAGLLLIGVGAYIQINSTHYLDFVSDNYLNTPIFIIIVGVVVFVIAFFGCCGAWNENSCLIYTYAACIVILLVAEIGAGIAALVLKGDLKNVVQNKMVNGLENYGKNGSEGMTQSWNLIQNDLKCCGVQNYTDWSTVPSFGAANLPDSCCKTETTGCGKNYQLASVNTVGCLVLVEDFVIGNIGIVGGVACAIVLVQVLTVLLACYVGRKAQKGYALV